MFDCSSLAHASACNELAQSTPRKRPSGLKTGSDNSLLQRMSGSEGNESSPDSPNLYTQQPIAGPSSPPNMPFSSMLPLNTLDTLSFDGQQPLLPQSQPFLSQPMLGNEFGQGSQQGYSAGNGWSMDNDFLQDSDPIFNLNFDPNYREWTLRFG